MSWIVLFWKTSVIKVRVTWQRKSREAVTLVRSDSECRRDHDHDPVCPVKPELIFSRASQPPNLQSLWRAGWYLFNWSFSSQSTLWGDYWAPPLPPPPPFFWVWFFLSFFWVLWIFYEGLILTLKADKECVYFKTQEKLQPLQYLRNENECSSERTCSRDSCMCGDRTVCD